MMGGPQSFSCATLFLGFMVLSLPSHAVLAWTSCDPAPVLSFRESSMTAATAATWSRMVPNRRKTRTATATRTSATRTTATRTSTRLYGALSRSAILKHSSSSAKKTSNKKKNHSQKYSTVVDKISRSRKTIPMESTDRQPLTRNFLLDALEEAMYRQTTALECLKAERKKLVDKLEGMENTDDENCGNAVTLSDYGDDEHSGKETPKKKERDPRTALDRVDARRLELGEKRTKLEELRRDLERMSAQKIKTHEPSSSFAIDVDSDIAAAESRFQAIIGSTGRPCPILDRPKDTWKIFAERHETEFGRPHGFTGLVFYSPLGVPILVGKQRAESDGILRRASQGSDLWFQVEDYEGSRVLLRSSLVSGTKNSKKCIQMAADLAARYSVWGNICRNHRYYLDTVPVMYTDSKHVAKRGTKEGRMRKRKSLGRVMGRPSSVKDITFGLEPS